MQNSLPETAGVQGKDEPRDGEAGAEATVLRGLAMPAPHRSPGPSPWTVPS